MARAAATRLVTAIISVPWSRSSSALSLSYPSRVMGICSFDIGYGLLLGPLSCGRANQNNHLGGLSRPCKGRFGGTPVGVSFWRSRRPVGVGGDRGAELGEQTRSPLQVGGRHHLDRAVHVAIG